jgi:hypothetical protein
VPKRPREIALAVLAALLVATTIWWVRSVGEPASAAPGRAGSTATTSQQPGAKRDLAEVDLDALKAERSEPAGSDRNPFTFKPKPPPPPPPESSAMGNKSAAPMETGPVEPPPPPPIPLKFIGLVNHADPNIGRVAVLSDSRGVYYGREGEIIEGRYRILKIGVESIDLAYLDGRGRQTIRQTGQ